MSRLNHKNTRFRRRGVMLIVVLACAAISMAMIANSFRAALQARREVQINLQRQQTEWLLTAGIQRARVNAGAAAEYTGETWDVSGDLPGFQLAQVTIDVKQPGQAEGVVQVTARLQALESKFHATQLSHEFTLVAGASAEATDPSNSSENPESSNES